jgi:hypothetical protein
MNIKEITMAILKNLKKIFDKIKFELKKSTLATIPASLEIKIKTRTSEVTPG